MAHARVTRVDVSAALARPGVVAAYTGADLADDLGGLPTAWTVSEDHEDAAAPPGRPRTRSATSGTPSPSSSPRAATPPPTPSRRSRSTTSRCLLCSTWRRRWPTAARSSTTTSVRTSASPTTRSTATTRPSKAKADVVLQRRYINQRLIPSAMEPRSVVVDPTGGSRLVHHLVGDPGAALRARLPLAGDRHPGAQDPGDRARTSAAASAPSWTSTPRRRSASRWPRSSGRPVKWTASRSEDMPGDHPRPRPDPGRRDRGHRRRPDARAARRPAHRHGRLPAAAHAGHRRCWAATCTRRSTSSSRTPSTARACSRTRPRPTPTAAPAGRRRRSPSSGPSTTWPPQLGTDPIELRRKNWIAHDEFPYTTVCGLEYDSGNYEAATARALELLGYDGLRAEQQRRRERGRPGAAGHRRVDLHRDVRAGAEPWLGEKGYIAGGWERATVRMTPLGKAEVVVGTSRTARATSRRSARSRPTRSACRSRTSRSSSTTRRPCRGAWTPTAPARSSSAGRRSARRADGLVEKAQAARRPPARGGPAATSSSTAGAFRVKGSAGVHARPSRSSPSRRSSHTRCRTAPTPILVGRLPDGPGDLLVPARHAPVRRRGRHRDRHDADPQVRLRRRRRQRRQPDDRRGPGARRHRAGHRAGAVRGGRLRRRRQPGHRHPRRLPGAGAADLPSFTTDRTETPSTTNPLGVKGVGEAGTIASTPAVVNAVVDALRHLGVDDVRMACTPERVWRAIQDASGVAATAATARPRARSPTAARDGDDRGRWRHDPGAVRLRPRRLGRRGGRGASARAATTPRCSPAASR